MDELVGAMKTFVCPLRFSLLPVDVTGIVLSFVADFRVRNATI